MDIEQSLALASDKCLVYVQRTKTDKPYVVCCWRKETTAILLIPYDNGGNPDAAY
jgi:hypothetical protein